MTTYRYTHTKTGETVLVFAGRTSDARRKFGDARRPALEAEFAGKIINLINVTDKAEGVWLEEIDSGPAFRAIGRVTIMVKTASQPKPRHETEKYDDQRTKAYFDRMGRGW